MSRSRQIVNGKINEFIDWRDIDGNIINASDGGVIYAEGAYHWYGQALRPLPIEINGKGGQTTTTGVVMYKSTDLVLWEYEGVILPCGGGDLKPPMRFERPKIIYNNKTKKYVLWCHYVKCPGDHGDTYGTAEAGAAVCDTVNGKYEWLGFSRPINSDGLVRDCSVFQDDDGSAYFLYDRQEGDDRCLHIVRLGMDYLSFTDEYNRIDAAYWREAPVVVKHDDYYYMITSGLTVWDFNRAKYFRTKSLMGNWEDMGDPCIGDNTHTTFNSQGTYIFKVNGTDAHIFMAERHNTSDFERCSYIWLPIEFGKNTLSLKYYKSWSL